MGIPNFRGGNGGGGIDQNSHALGKLWVAAFQNAKFAAKIPAKFNL
jgi:hypothetical protein